ncbi:hypothetical protein [Sunxiuqinia rutila]|uniref:hypothetical protein n=1 Tax=Sunxiuqinia rutila TaxID=1397841 RepID=UPI003D3663AD
MTTRTNSMENQKPNYTLEKIKAFADSDAESLRLILNSLVQSSRQNLELFRQHLQQCDEQALTELAHKMLPLFKQLEAREVVTLLSQLEEGRLTRSERESLSRNAIVQIEALLSTLVAEQSLED